MHSRHWKEINYYYDTRMYTWVWPIVIILSTIVYYILFSILQLEILLRSQLEQLLLYTTVCLSAVRRETCSIIMSLKKQIYIVFAWNQYSRRKYNPNILFKICVVFFFRFSFILSCTAAACLGDLFNISVGLRLLRTQTHSLNDSRARSTHIIQFFEICTS